MLAGGAPRFLSGEGKTPRAQSFRVTRPARSTGAFNSSGWASRRGTVPGMEKNDLSIVPSFASGKKDYYLRHNRRGRSGRPLTFSRRPPADIISTPRPSESAMSANEPARVLVSAPHVHVLTDLCRVME